MGDARRQIFHEAVRHVLRASADRERGNEFRFRVYRQIATANTTDTARLFVENLPALLAGTKIGKVNLGDPVIVTGLARLIGSINNP